MVVVMEKDKRTDEYYDKLAFVRIEKLEALIHTETDGPRIHVRQCKYLVQQLANISRKRRLLRTRGGFYRKRGSGFFWLVKRAETLVHNCCSKDWLQAALARLDFQEAFQDLAHDFSEMEEGNLVAKLRLQARYLNELEELYREDLEDIVNRLFKIWRFHDLFRCCGGYEVEISKYLWQRWTPQAPARHLEQADISEPAAHFVRGMDLSASETWLGRRCLARIFHGHSEILFSDEAKVLALLNHPNVVQVFCASVSNLRCTLLVEQMDTTLQTYLRITKEDRQPLLYDVKIDIMTQISKGMEYLHEVGLVYCDLKSSKIHVQWSCVAELREEGYVWVKVADYGTLKPQLNDAFEESDFSKKKDVFNFGLLCYEIISGEVANSKADSDSRPQLPQDCPRNLIDVVSRCWSRIPENRPSFSEIRKLLTN